MLINFNLQDVLYGQVADIEAKYKEIEKEHDQYKYLVYQINMSKIMVAEGNYNELYVYIIEQLINYFIGAAIVPLTPILLHIQHLLLT